ncbi:acyltransferase family protein [Nocardioides pantholopis]|uniref:acyltransferase family protein n=1 Tax=Nocardioides pantholopis TaxID=2483798 RepID=UPI0013DE25DF|nr:acyltransferase family protein [Nocardioides pantholopis]
MRAGRRASSQGDGAAADAGSGARRGFRGDIQGLRAVAVLLVVADHAGLGPLHGGFIGVDVFLVVSGFLITGLLLAEVERSGTVSLAGFYARRARRILPAASLVLAVTAVAGYLILAGADLLRLVQDSIWAAFFAANIKFARDETDYWAQDESTSPIQHYWSLAVEEQFYLVWPLLLVVLVLLLRRRARAGSSAPATPGAGAVRRAALATIALLSLASFALAVRGVAADPTGTYFSTAARVWELGLGAGLAAAMPWVARRPAAVRGLLAWAGLAAVAASALLFTEATRVPGWPALLPVLGAGALLACGDAPVRWGPARALSVAPLRWVGDRSYSLYLWHWPVLVLGAALLEVRGLSGWQALAAVLLALVLSDLSYRFVENPVRHTQLLRGRRRGLVLYPASLAALGVVLAVVHTVVVHDFAQPRPPVTAAAYADRGLAKDPHVALVQASVLAGRADAEVPSPLRPAALGLSDRVAADLGECSYSGQDYPLPLCPRGDPDGEKVLVVLGDSHGRHWAEVLDGIARKHGYRAYFLVLAGCNAASVQPWSAVDDAPDEECAAFHAWSQEQVEQLRPDVTVLSNDTVGAYVGPDGERVSDTAEVARLLEDGLTERLASLRPLAERVVVLADVPRLRTHPSDISRRGATLGDGLAKPNGRSMRMRDAAKRAAERAGAEHVETRQWFCAYGECPVVVGDFITRRDYGHLTLEYAASLADPLDRALALR